VHSMKLIRPAASRGVSYWCQNWRFLDRYSNSSKDEANAMRSKRVPCTEVTASTRPDLPRVLSFYICINWYQLL
jgi:hypothetical protein